MNSQETGSGPSKESSDHDPSAIEWQVAYDATTSLYTHPRQLAALMMMRGLTPPPPESARILELGCATGGNLNSIALSLPEAECIGIDPFGEQIELAQSRARRAGIDNVTYLPLGVSDLDQLSGPFDYIIAHGLFSWISDAHREDTLRLCKELLSPQGVAYISYNTYPHWHTEQVTRDLLRWQHQVLNSPIKPRGALSSPELIKASREALDLFGRYAFFGSDEVLQSIYQTSAHRLKSLPDWYLVHEYLLEHNRAFHFQEWIKWARRYDLHYLGDASPNTDLAYTSISRNLRRELSFANHDPIALEQGLDLLLNRGLRRSLVCRQDPGADWVSSAQLEPWTQTRLRDSALFDELFVASHYRVTGGLSDLNQSAHYQNTTSKHLPNLEIRDASEHALLLLLGSAWPQQLSLREVFTQAETLLRDLGDSGRGISARLSAALHRLLARDAILSPTWGRLESPQRPIGELPTIMPFILPTYERWPQSFPNQHHTSAFPSEALHWLFKEWGALNEGGEAELRSQLNSSPYASHKLEDLIEEAHLLGLLH